MKHLYRQKYIVFLALLFIIILMFPKHVLAASVSDIPIPKIGVNVDSAKTPTETATSIQIILLLTILSLAPSILILMTSFTRIIIVLSFVRNALGTQNMPPNQVLIGLALFLSFFIMSPIVTDINTNAYQPYIKGKITQSQAITNTMKPLRQFMLKQTYKKDLNMFISLSKTGTPATIDNIPTRALIPAFVTSELKRAFEIGFLIYIPFVVIDMIVASTLMSMGMMMLPPSMISLPFKILLFILVDGWDLVIKTLVISFK